MTPLTTARPCTKACYFRPQHCMFRAVENRPRNISVCCYLCRFFVPRWYLQTNKCSVDRKSLSAAVQQPSGVCSVLHADLIKTFANKMSKCWPTGLVRTCLSQRQAISTEKYPFLQWNVSKIFLSTQSSFYCNYGPDRLGFYFLFLGRIA